jgi:hypothetical protein
LSRAIYRSFCAEQQNVRGAGPGFAAAEGQKHGMRTVLRRKRALGGVIFT